MNAKQLTDEILGMLYTIRDDQHKLEILHEFMTNNIHEEPIREDIPEKYKEAVREIAENLLAGFVCFFNPDTLEVESLPKDLVEDPEEFELMTGESWESEERKHEQWGKCIEIIPMESNEAFRIMEDFTGQVDNQHLQKKLVSALNNRGPFANFKFLVEGSDYRDQWFEFRQQATEWYVWDLLSIDLGETH